MKKGVSVWNNNGHDVLLDPDSCFWATWPHDEKGLFVSGDILTLRRRVGKKLLAAMEEFRFSQELTAVYIDPTDRCNANCAYCYLPSGARKHGRSMTGEELELILDKLADHFRNQKRKQTIIFHAAEPLLVKDILFEAIAKYEGKFKFGLQTNALLLEKEDVAFLKKQAVGVGVSMDSFSRPRNNKQRPSVSGSGNHKQVLKALEWFDGYPGLNVISTVTRFNVSDLAGTVKFLHERSVPCVLLNPVRFTRVSVKNLKPDEKIFADEFIKAVDTSMELTQRTGRKIIVGNFANTVLAIVAPEARRLMCDISPCGGGRCFFTIAADGSMMPCGEFSGRKEYYGGNIFRDDIANVMRSRPFQKVRGRYVENIPECADCDLRNICGAPCPAELSALGAMRQKSIFCDFYKDVIHYAFKIIAEGKTHLVLRDEALNNLSYEYQLNNKESL